MEYIASHYGRRINLIAIYTILPLLSADVLKQYFSKFLNTTLSLIENFLYMKQTQPSASALISPIKGIPILHLFSIS